jgi:glutamate---cysteine ligase / carboxylate-amine ligase
VRGSFVIDGVAVPVAEMLDRVIDETAADARELGCVAEIDRCRTIAGAGTSADAQLAVFEAHRGQDGHDEALRAVSDWLAVATMQ